MSWLETTWRRVALQGPKQPIEAAGLTLLRPLSWLYALIQGVRARMYRAGWFSTYRAGVPVLSVGNLAVGGTGKTPVILALVKRALERGIAVAVVSRGYGGTYADPTFNVTLNRTQPDVATLCGDEPLLIARTHPACTVVVARKRALGVAVVEDAGAELILLDDGFQHLAVERDLDLVLLDQRRPFGNGLVFPAGILREPAAALDRADQLLYTRCAAWPSASGGKGCRFTLCTTLVGVQGQKVPFAQLQGQKGAAFAGIADADRFFDQLADAGLLLGARLSFGDHHAYPINSIERLTALIDSEKIDYLITTEKDAIKLERLTWDVPLYTATLELDFWPEGFVDDLLDQVMSKKEKQ